MTMLSIYIAGVNRADQLDLKMSHPLFGASQPSAPDPLHNRRKNDGFDEHKRSGETGWAELSKLSRNEY